VLNIAIADTVFTIWSAKRFYGAVATEVTWRPFTAITLAATDGNPDTVPDADWVPLITTPSHPEYLAGLPSLNGAAATVLLSQFGDKQTFTLTTTGQPSRTYSSITQAHYGRKQRPRMERHALPSTVATSSAVGRAIARHVDRNCDGVMDHSELQRDDRTAHRVWGRPFYEPPFGRRDLPVVG
jgi:hypothetical protein